MSIRVRLMDEFSSRWPVWVDDHGQETERFFSVSAGLDFRLRLWADEFDKSFHVDDGWATPEIAASHAREGETLAAELQSEIGDGFRVELVLIREP